MQVSRDRSALYRSLCRTIGMKVELGESLATAINAGAENVVKVPKAEAEMVASGEEIVPVVDEIYQLAYRVVAPSPDLSQQQETNKVVKVPKAEAEVVASGDEIAPVVDEIYQFTDAMKPSPAISQQQETQGAFTHDQKVSVDGVLANASTAAAERIMDNNDHGSSTRAPTRKDAASSQTIAMRGEPLPAAPNIF